MLNDKVLPSLRVTWLAAASGTPPDQGTEYSGKRESHEYSLYLTLEDIDHSRTKARHPQTNGICERFPSDNQNEFYAVAFRKRSLDGRNYRRIWISG